MGSISDRIDGEVHGLYLPFQTAVNTDLIQLATRLVLLCTVWAASHVTRRP